ncbi:MAG: patatin-like phospholipase family protein, partial [Acidobacteriota bacterium]|nr:patatin-like phospholipase family protein [Acidobacteriota bacterium]
NRSDHFYHLKKRVSDEPAPGPADALTASKQKRVVVVAANGGGIQAGAWAAKVLYGLREDCGEPFERSLRMISSVSGGSVGNASFVNWLASDRAGRRPDEAAAESSLDEVAWGLAYPDFLRALIPWLFGAFIRIGRGRALEEAWLLNSGGAGMDEPLSSWNEKARRGALPAVVLNATITETGERLLLATTRINQHAGERAARVDAADLHTINGERLDVAVVTAARLSASFPYVTPAARADRDGPFPHVVDGGYYDNYGMATTVDWLDDALDQAGGEVESVLVIQIHGAPVNADPQYKRRKSNRGWFYQAFAPLQTILEVRDAGQIAHNDIELELLQEKWWSRAGLPIHSVTFEFCKPSVPLSWHLTPNEVREIELVWREDMTTCRGLVGEFLSGEDGLNCGCVACASAAGRS